MAGELQDEPTVAIFWDYENCEIPGNADAYSVAGGIRRIAHEYGTVNSFRAYFEMAELVSPRSVAIRSDLQACGVSLIDCPHNGRKDVADKMILVDMLTHAMDCVSPSMSTIVLISSDRDFLYAVSTLRLRKFRVILMANNSLHVSLRMQASAVYEWPRQILLADAMTALGQPDLRPRGGSASTSNGAYRACLLTPPPPKTSLPATPEDGVSGPATQPIIPPQPPSPALPTYSRAGAPPSVLLGARSRISSISVGHNRSASTNDIPPSTPPRKSWADVVTRGSASDSGTKETQLSRGNDAASAPLPWRSPRVLFAAALQRGSAFTPANITSAEQLEAAHSQQGSENKNVEQTANEQDKLMIIHTSASTDEDRTEPTQNGLLPAFEPTSMGLSQFTPSPSTRSDMSLYPDPPSMTGFLGTGSSPTSSEPLDPNTTVSVQVHPDVVIPTVVMIRLRKPPPKYKLLVRVLERERVEGNTRVVFSQLGSMLRQEHPSVYQRAGATKLNEYISMAEQDGIVIVGKTDWESLNGNRWVALHPTYHGKPPEAIQQVSPALQPAPEVVA